MIYIHTYTCKLYQLGYNLCENTITINVRYLRIRHPTLLRAVRIKGKQFLKNASIYILTKIIKYEV